jgi:hypothetical protein
MKRRSNETTFRRQLQDRGKSRASARSLTDADPEISISCGRNCRTSSLSGRRTIPNRGPALPLPRDLWQHQQHWLSQNSCTSDGRKPFHHDARVKCRSSAAAKQRFSKPKPNLAHLDAHPRQSGAGGNLSFSLPGLISSPPTNTLWPSPYSGSARANSIMIRSRWEMCARRSRLCTSKQWHDDLRRVRAADPV